jgi:hypothetical protein
MACAAKCRVQQIELRARREAGGATYLTLRTLPSAIAVHGPPSTDASARYVNSVGDTGQQ